MPRGRPPKMAATELLQSPGSTETPLVVHSKTNGNESQLSQCKEIVVKSEVLNTDLSNCSPVNGNNCRSSGRQIKKRVLDAPIGQALDKHRRQCEKTGCTASIPICFASANERCSGRGYTSRWYHMSLGEHFCNECFDYYYRSHKEGYKEYAEWKQLWSTHGRLEASIKAFMADRELPYWAQCALCNKWRQLSRDALLTPRFLEQFKCRSTRTHLKDSDACQIPEDSRVQSVCEPYWIQYLALPALLKDSPSSKYLQEYYADGVGLSPTSHFMEVPKQKDKSEDSSRNIVKPNSSDWKKFHSCNEILQPFYQPTEQRKALCFRPDVMEPDEVAEFPEYARDQVMYLGIRNLIVALWNQNPKEWLAINSVAQQVVCRGLVRIRCVEEARRILTFFTKKGIVNCGLITSPKGFCLTSSSHQESVIVIGAGPSGLAAAKHLTNLGVQVTVLEATNRTGGRVWDDTSLGGVCVGRGAQIVTGVINNPVSVMCKQADIEMRIIGERCDLFHEDGRLANHDADQRVDFHFNAMLDSVAEWRKSQENDTDLLTKLNEMHQFFMEETGIRFSEEERNLVQFHMSNLEYACGSSLKQVSSLQWDQNEHFPQFAGAHGLLPFGYGALLTLLAKDLDLRMEHSVEAVDYAQQDKVIVRTSQGKTFEANKVIVTVPLTILQKGQIEFDPPLPEQKCLAFKELGAGIIEKVALQFPKRFWERKLEGADFFGHIPTNSEQRGLFSIFYDLTPSRTSKKKESNCVLMSYVSGDAVQLLKGKTDQEVVDMCMTVLKKMFRSEISVPPPSNWLVTHWHREPYAEMAYSYIKVGGTGEAYDQLAQNVNNQLFFAGEATNRQFPQTVSGALLSGIREASKILS